MSERATLRGSRLGSTSFEDESGIVMAERRVVSYDCPKGHEVKLTFAAEAEVPDTWDCPRCGALSPRSDYVAPERKPEKPVRTHWDMLRERRTDAELEELLQERLDLLRSGELKYGEHFARYVSPTVKTTRGRKSA